MTTVREQMRQRFEKAQLSPAQRRLARYLLQNSAEAAYVTSQALATSTGVSQASVVRFAKMLGYSGYPEFQKDVQSWSRASTAEPLPVAAAEDELGRYWAGELEAMQNLATNRALNTRLREAGELLASSRPLIVMGLRMGEFAAEEFAFLGSKVHPSIRTVTRGDSTGIEILERAIADGASTVLLFAPPRYPRELESLVDKIIAAGLTLILVTDNEIMPLSPRAAILFATRPPSQLAFDSHVGAHAILNCLLHTMFEALDPKSQARLEEFERLVESNNLFLESI